MMVFFLIPKKIPKGDPKEVPKGMPKGNTKEIPKEVPKEIPKVVSKKGAHRGFQRVSQRGFPGKLNLQTPDQLLKAVAKAWVAEAAKFSLSLCCSLFSLVPSGWSSGSTL